MNALGSASQILLAGAFMLGSLSKVLAVRNFQTTLISLGLGETLAKPAAAGVIVLEFIIGLSLVLVPSRPWPRIVVAVLAIGFAVAGVAALRTKRRISCNCFGSVWRGVLGWRQLALLPVWLILVVLAQLRPPTWRSDHVFLGLAVLLSALVWWQLVRELKLWHEMRQERLALEPGPAKGSQTVTEAAKS